MNVERFRTDLHEAGIEDMLATLLAAFAEDALLRFATLEGSVKQGKGTAIEIAAHAFGSSKPDAANDDCVVETLPLAPR